MNYHCNKFISIYNEFCLIKFVSIQKIFKSNKYYFIKKLKLIVINKNLNSLIFCFYLFNNNY